MYVRVYTYAVHFYIGLAGIHICMDGLMDSVYTESFWTLQRLQIVYSTIERVVSSKKVHCTNTSKETIMYNSPPLYIYITNVSFLMD